MMFTFFQLDRVQGLVDAEGERRVELARAEREACEANDSLARARVMDSIVQCDCRTQALALLTMFLFTALHLCQDQIEEHKQQLALHQTRGKEQQNGDPIAPNEERLL